MLGAAHFQQWLLSPISQEDTNFDLESFGGFINSSLVSFRSG